VRSSTIGDVLGGRFDQRIGAGWIARVAFKDVFPDVRQQRPNYHATAIRLAGGNSMRFGLSSLDRIARHVHRPAHAKALGDLPQLGAGCRKETAQQPAVAELLHPVLPVLGTTTEPLEDPGQLR
jgi:hypothetical protein